MIDYETIMVANVTSRARSLYYKLEGGRGEGGEGDGRAGKQQDGVIDIMTCGCMNHSTTEYIDSM